MSDRRLRIVFLGTPNFAIPTLKRLLEWEEGQVVLVVTQPDRITQQRGRRITPPPVKRFLQDTAPEVPLVQPSTLKRTEAESLITPYAPFDVGVVVAYGLFIPRWLRELPRLGMINAHPSLLPKLRGAAPIQWAIINGDTETGMTIQRVVKEIDAGEILWQKRIPIKETDTALTLSERLADLAAEGIIETIKALDSGTVTPTPQDHSQATYAPKITQEIGFINWQKSAREVFNLIRGLLPWPCAWTLRSGHRLKIQGAELASDCASEEPGVVVSVSKRGIEICCGSGTLLITHLQPENRGPMHAQQYINGYRVAVGERWGQ